MTRTELAVTIAGLVATFCLPWPESAPTADAYPLAAGPANQAPGRAALAAPHCDFGRVRTGPTEGIQPMR